MNTLPPKFRREKASTRKQALIGATLEIIAEQGIAAATVRAISQRANVTQGIIRYYFSSKDELICAAYIAHMTEMTEQISQASQQAFQQEQVSAKMQLAAFVIASLTPPVIDAKSVSVWASFLNKIPEDHAIQMAHEQTYYAFRNRLEGLISKTLKEEKIDASAPELRHLAIASNAVIDGLWMEGSVLSAGFNADELPNIGLRSVGAIIGVELNIKGRQS